MSNHFIPEIKVYDNVGGIAPEAFKPDDPRYFGFKLYLYIGPKGTDIKEQFQVTVCTPKWFEDHGMCGAFQPGSGRLFVKSWDWSAIHSFLEEYVASCEDEVWTRCALKISRLAGWEFFHEAVEEIEK